MSAPSRYAVKSATLTFGSATFEMETGPFLKAESKDAVEVTALADSVKTFIPGALKETDEFTVTLYAKGSSDITVDTAAGALSIAVTLENRYDKGNQKYFDFSGRLDYQHKGKNNPENIFTLSYLVSTSDTHYQIEENYHDYYQLPVDYTKHYSDNDGMFIEHTFQADFEHPFNKNHKIDFGAKYILRDNDSYVKQSYDDKFINPSDFTHITDIGALYGEYRYTNGKWTAKAGLRYEYSYLSARFRDGSNDDFSRNLHDFVPFAGVSFIINEANSLKFNYSSRVERPGIDYLNPARIETFTQVSYGNPYLKSSRPNNLALTYSLMKQKFMMTLTASAKMNNNGISELSWEKDGVRYSTYDNIARYRQYSMDTYIRWQMFKTTTFSLNGSVFHAKYSNNELGLSNQGFGAFLRPSVTQILPAGISLIADYMWMQQPISSLYTKYGGIGFYNLSLQRSFGKEQRLTCRISASNFLSGKYETMKSERVNGDFTGFSNTQYKVRSAGLMISYRFGSINSTVKKVNKSIENDDLVGQKKDSNNSEN